MKNGQIKKATTVFCLIAVLMITAFIPAISSMKIDNDNDVGYHGNVLKATNKINIINPIVSATNYDTMRSLALSENISLEDIIVANETIDEYKPSIIVSGGRILAGYECEDENGTFISIKQSSDYGQNWSDPIVFSDTEYNFTNPSFTKLLSGQGFGFGSFLTPENSSYVFELLIDSFSNTNSWDLNTWDYSNITDNEDNFLGAFFDLETPDTIYFNDPNIPWIIGTIGDSEFISGNENLNGQDMPIFFHQDPSNPSESRIIVFFPEITGCNNISISPGKNSTGHSMVYGVCEIANGTNSNLMFFHGNPDVWGDEDLLRKQYINSSEDFKHPKILVDDNNIYITVETSTQGIVLYHSSNHGGSWDVYNITSDLPSIVNPIYPLLKHNNTHLICSFYNSGNLSISSTEKSDINWSEPIQINDVNGSVEPGYNFYDIYDINRVIWTDDRNESLDIYYQLSYVPSIDLVVVDFELVKEDEIMIIPTRNYISITVENLGDAPAQDILINVTYKFNETDYPVDSLVYIDYLGPNQNTTVNRPLFRFELKEIFNALIDFAGMESMTVHVDPEETIDDRDRDNNIRTKDENDDISYSTIFKRLGPFEEFFKGLKPKI